MACKKRYVVEPRKPLSSCMKLDIDAVRAGETYREQRTFPDTQCARVEVFKQGECRKACSEPHAKGVSYQA